MTRDLAAATTVPDEVIDLADRIEAAIERSGSRGISPARAARSARCTTADARTAIAYLVGYQHAHLPGRSWRHVRSGRAA